MQESYISHHFQGAFSKGKRGTDYIFMANTLIDQAKHLNLPLYAAFIDLQKAYDSVNRPLLFRKMVMCGLGPCICQLIEHMYIQSTSFIKVGAKLGQSFTTNVGLRQGDPLSPLLFKLFIADIIFAFKSNCELPSLHDLPIPSIQFAEDICNFSTSLQGIRNSINTTVQYCQANKLKVNISKSCYTTYNTLQTIHQPIIIEGKTLPYDAHPCFQIQIFLVIKCMETRFGFPPYRDHNILQQYKTPQRGTPGGILKVVV